MIAWLVATQQRLNEARAGAATAQTSSSLSNTWGTMALAGRFVGNGCVTDVVIAVQHLGGNGTSRSLCRKCVRYTWRMLVQNIRASEQITGGGRLQGVT